ncbi:MAG: hypothetical protein K6B41_00780 [Butyrivibrio sp.]|nr:hypothetical protein [Butyrivibrio sp.]
MNTIDKREVTEAINAADDALMHLNSARQCLNSASNWGLLDMFGGNMITGLFKHGKMASAEREIEQARYSLQKFSRELRDVHGFSSIHINDFLSFADFFFDGFVADVLVQSKISSAKRQCDEAIRRVQDIRNQLAGML